MHDREEKEKKDEKKSNHIHACRFRQTTNKQKIINTER